MMRKIKYPNIIKRVRILCGLFLVGILLMLQAGCGTHDKALVYSWQEETEPLEVTEAISQDDKLPEASAVEEAYVYVHVCGAVAHPGVVKLPVNSRVEDALLAAGGFVENASAEYVNLASRVEDGQQLFFPTKEEAELKQQEKAVSEAGLVNINSADETLLCTLPGIGESRAGDIIAYREAEGFTCIEDIMKVPGIKQSTYDKLKDKITVR